MVCTGMAPEAVSGAWQLLAEVSAQDPSAPSWEFLQVLPLHND